ncbi:hypothetical protein RB213_008870, partial [Colletotrichum asianum]
SPQAILQSANCKSKAPATQQTPRTNNPGSNSMIAGDTPIHPQRILFAPRSCSKTIYELIPRKGLTMAPFNQAGPLVMICLSPLHAAWVQSHTYPYSMKMQP